MVFRPDGSCRKGDWKDGRQSGERVKIDADGKATICECLPDDEFYEY